MSTQTSEITGLDATTSPAIAHVYCVCNEGRTVALSMCGAGSKPTADLRLLRRPLPNSCVVCLEMADAPCPRCGA